jgi:hypothetical protein
MLLAIIAASHSLATAQPAERQPPTSNDAIDRVIDAAHAQVGKTLHYDPRYVTLTYPGGDLPIERGVCTDVVIRAFRAIDIDLQKLVHEDMRRAFKVYPPLWGRHAPDRNIDHRRVPNLQTFFRRHWLTLSLSQGPADYLPGDLVTWRLPAGVPHIGIVSSQRTGDRPLIVHNIGAGTKLEDSLFAFTITGH